MELGELIEQHSLISIVLGWAVICIIGVLKICGVFDQISNKNGRKFIFLICNLILSLTIGLLFSFGISLGLEIFVVTAIEYSIYENTGLRNGWQSILNKLLKFIRGRNKMTRSTVLQKILTSVIGVFGVGGVVVGILPNFTPIATEITTYATIISEAIATVSGIWLFGTSDKVLTEEEVAEEKAIKDEKAKEKEIAKAKAIVEEYEKAKAIIEESTKNN